MKPLKVCWISAGVSSFVAGWLARDTVDKYIYIDIADQHPDSMRFIKDCERALGKPVEIIRSTEYQSVEQAARACGAVRMTHNGFAPCTAWLKKRVRKQWEYEHRDYAITYVWGFDAEESTRAARLENVEIEFSHEFPLIEHNMTKADAHGLLYELGIKRPVMYDMGYKNNNCIYAYDSTHYDVICCFNSGGCGASTGKGHDTPEAAAEAWNRRADNGTT